MFPEAIQRSDKSKGFDIVRVVPGEEGKLLKKRPKKKKKKKKKKKGGGGLRT